MNMCSMFYLCMTSCSLLPLLKLPLGLRLLLSLLLLRLFYRYCCCKPQCSQKAVKSSSFHSRAGLRSTFWGCGSMPRRRNIVVDFAWFCCYVSCLRSSKKPNLLSFLKMRWIYIAEAKSLRSTRCHLVPYPSAPRRFWATASGRSWGPDVDDLSPSRKQPSNATLKRISDNEVCFAIYYFLGSCRTTVFTICFKRQRQRERFLLKQEVWKNYWNLPKNPID